MSMLLEVLLSLLACTAVNTAGRGTIQGLSSNAISELSAPYLKFSERLLNPITSQYVRYPAEAQPHLGFEAIGSDAAYNGAEQVHLQMGHDSSTVILTWSASPYCEGLGLAAANASCGASFREASPAGMPHAGDISGMPLQEEFVSCATQKTLQYRKQHRRVAEDTKERVRYVILSGLKPSARYIYRIHNSNFAGHFRTTPRKGSDSITFGVVGDVGQTRNSKQTMDHMFALKDSLDMILHAGDISYADFEQPRWDSYGRLSQFLFASLPAIYTGGNHEIENGWLDFLARYPQDTSPSGSTSPFWFSSEHGPAHITVLNPYVDYGPESEQMSWLLENIAQVDRSITPWLIVLFHVPWYNSNSYHHGEGDSHRAALEVLLMDAGVDFVFSGHVHSYERFVPTFHGEYNRCGITYVNIGDGGNREGRASNWRPDQPPISALREDSYGSGVLKILSSTEAVWEWHRNQDGVHTISDSVSVIRSPDCPNQRMMGAATESYL